jgi:hypothetical protein
MVYHGKNTFHKVEGHGYVGFKFFGIMIKYLEKVLHDLSLCRNLSRVVNSRHKLEFTTHIGCINDKDGIKIATTQTDGKLYRLGMSNYDTTKESKIGNIAQLSIVEKYIDVELWHHRFGHLWMDGLKQLQTWNLVHGFDLKKLNDLLLCVSCFQGKQYKNKFPKQGGTTKELFKLIYTSKFVWTHARKFN